ncbi:uncharacterized protein [Elaeis guineensis]|uniref:Uncharacterized protein LOC105041199 n=1 Tax=Elaeis guineensis var. tenera TaxID=51953 RepID=A0A6I9R1F7_ELAGV|nr:uncharacterized protein LOC105041199 [Elaeis guineensis]
MKRNRAEPAPSKAPETLAKTQRRSKDPSPKGTGTTRARAGAVPPEKPRKGGGPEKRPSAPAAVDSSPIAPAMAQEEDDKRPLGWDEFGGWWWWGVEEEMLLGWFPFVEEDFLCSENRGGSGLFWEEEDHDIWQLQDIHEIPNQAK